MIGGMKLAAALIACSGCSFATVARPTARNVALRECTTSRKAPVIDAVIGVTGLIVAVAAWTQPLDDPATPQNETAENLAVGIPFTAASAAVVASSIWGFRTVSRCERALDAPLVRQ